MKIFYKNFDPLTLPLTGEQLIEASAGTGKTFTISLIYLRLLLGLGGKTAFCRPLSVEEILVVTFTKAAIAELRSRIRFNIHQLRIACIRHTNLDAALQPLMNEISDYSQAASILLIAERQMDEAAIFTIHGFCQRMLNLNAFESGILFEQKLIEDEMPIRRRATADFWRRHFYQVSLPIARAISRLWSNPEQLLKTILPWLSGEMPLLKSDMNLEENIQQRYKHIISRIDTLKHAWLGVKNILLLVIESDIDRRSYRKKCLIKWIEKINKWANKVTEDYDIPKELNFFRYTILSKKTKKGTPPLHPVFNLIDIFLDQPLSLRDLIIARAIREVRYFTQQEKRLHSQIGFDDLLEFFDNALKYPKGKILASTIRQRYPVALIDEFQDTNPQQYRIFNMVYLNQPDSMLLLIGDPKQAIYTFRGANIFAYMNTRSKVSAHYTLDINWRSSPSMIKAVNQLFLFITKPFIFKEIPFFAVKPAKSNVSLSFNINGIPQPAISLWVQEGEFVKVNDYEKFMARQCAAQIASWLLSGKKGIAMIGKTGTQHPVQASDITILVRSYSEANAMRKALQDFAIPSAYLSNRDSVFATLEAREILLLLQAVLNPDQGKLLRSVLASSLFGLDAEILNNLFNDDHAWDALVDEFIAYRQHWLKRGIMPMLRKLMIKRNIAEDILASNNGEQRLINLLHIGELLQVASVSLDSNQALVRWLNKQIENPDISSIDQHIRIESDINLIQIVSIHKAKGLQYPLVCLPFAANFCKAKNTVYHDRKTLQILIDLQEKEESMILADEERLAEDLRLLYVALTRSIYHCSVGIAPLIKGKRKKDGNSDLHFSAIGYLIQKGKAKNAAGLRSSIEKLCSNEIELVFPNKPHIIKYNAQKKDERKLIKSQKLIRSLQDHWRITSYSELHQKDTTTDNNLYIQPYLNINNTAQPSSLSSSNKHFIGFNQHTFPRGASSGKFLHNLLEHLDFTKPINKEWLQLKLISHGLDEEWLPMMIEWIELIIQTPLNKSGVTLQQLSTQMYQVELQFYLPIQKLLTPNLLNLLMYQDPISINCPKLDFQKIQGMLKGFIDLVFYWDGKYYLLDYKSNWLGEDSNAYTRPAIIKEMQFHRYDLQYQLYTLAIHRYLRHRLPNYDYHQNFGGVIYLFLRGLDSKKIGHSIYNVKPNAEFISALDRLFSQQLL